MFAYCLPESLIKGLSIRAKEMGAINLGQGIPSFPTAAHIIESVKKALDEPAIGVYPNFLGEKALREAIALRHVREEKIVIDESNILVTVGAMEGTAAAIFATVGGGDRVGILTPDYCNHVPQVILARGQVVEIPLIETRGWALDLGKLEEEAKKGLKLIVLTNPNNPTGSLLGKDDLTLLVALAKKYGIWLLADETYAFLTYGVPFVSLLSFWNEYDKILVVRSFSKEYAMTGWRVGYVVSGSQTIKAIAKVHDALTGCAPKISQRAALAALTGPQAAVDGSRVAYTSRLEKTMHMLDASLDRLSYVKPQGAYYLFLKYEREGESIVVCEELLTRSKVAAVPGSAFGLGGEGHIRISFAVDDAILSEGLERMIRFFQ